MKAKILRYLKYLTILLLVAASVGGTCYIFLKNLNKSKNSFLYVTNFVLSSNANELSANVNKVNGLTSNRFSTYLETYENLNDITLTLNSYLVSTDNSTINSKKIVNEFSSLVSSQSYCNSVAEELIHKIKLNQDLNNTSFKKDVAGNELFNQTNQVLLQYSKALKTLNEELNKLNLNKSADLKFSVIELYLDVVETSFSQTERVENVLYLNNDNNIKLINSHFELENSVLQVKNVSNNSNFSVLNNYFVKAYEHCDKLKLAENFKELLTETSSLSEESSNEQKAIYYYKAIYGI